MKKKEVQDRRGANPENEKWRNKMSPVLRDNLYSIPEQKAGDKDLCKVIAPP